MPSTKLIRAGSDSLPEYVRRYLEGESVQTLAAEHHVAPRTIYRWMMSELGDGYQQAITHVLIDRVADADMALMDARDTCQIARAREMARFARMDLERRRPHLYGQRQQVEIKHRSLRDVSDADLARVIEAAATRVPDTQHDAEQYSTDSEDDSVAE